FQGLAFIILNLGIMVYAIKYWSIGLLTAGDFGLLFLYIGQMNDRLWDFGKNVRGLYESLADANEMTAMLMEPHKITDSNKDKELLVQYGQIEFANVSFF